MRILFVSGEVTPFASVTKNADLIRKLPELLNEEGNYEVRIIMPRYGTISERRNRLHEVIRLSGSVIKVGAREETLKVKVASIPGIRLQVYFMDNAYYFKRKGVFADRKTQAVFADNVERALFFGRSALQTTKNLGWKPDLIHATGWMSSFVPMLVKNEHNTDPLFEQAKLVYTPDDMEVDVSLASDLMESLPVDDESLVGIPLNDVGAKYADAMIPANESDASSHSLSSETDEELLSSAMSFYDQVLTNKVLA